MLPIFLRDHNGNNVTQLSLPSHLIENFLTTIFNFNEFMFVYVADIRFICDVMGSFDIGRPRARGWKNFGRRRERGWAVLDKIGQFSWTSLCIVPKDLLDCLNCFN